MNCWKDRCILSMALSEMHNNINSDEYIHHCLRHTSHFNEFLNRVICSCLSQLFYFTRNELCSVKNSDKEEYDRCNNKYNKDCYCSSETKTWKNILICMFSIFNSIS